MVKLNSLEYHPKVSDIGERDENTALSGEVSYSSSLVTEGANIAWFNSFACPHAHHFNSSVDFGFTQGVFVTQGLQRAATKNLYLTVRGVLHYPRERL